MSLFSNVELAPRDPILGLNEQFTADQKPGKVNLGVGVYLDENGKLPLLQAVQQAQTALIAEARPRGYLPIDGMPAYTQGVKALAFGSDSELISSDRVAVIQSLGGTGALKVGADFLKTIHPHARVLISQPSWENHRAIFSNAGFEVSHYTYYDASRRTINFQGMLTSLQTAARGSIVVLHACCHNPTGYDLSSEQWDSVVAMVKERELVAFLDMAYQGFSEGLQEDSAVVGKFARAGLSFLLATSFSKSFSLYGERVGALCVVTESREETARVLSQLKVRIRVNYSNPPTFGASVVAHVLSHPGLHAMWDSELGEMRSRIKHMRRRLCADLEAAGVQQDVSYITKQVGMFSYSGLTKEQMVRLREEFGVYGTDAGRICVAALNENNVGYVAQSIARVLL